MRILHIISDTILGGAQKVCIDLANSAAKDGETVAIAAMKGGYLWDQLDANIIQFQIDSLKKKINVFDIKVLIELKKIRSEYKPDIIHLHTTKPGVLGRIAFKKDKKHIVYTVHGFDVVRTEHRKFLPIEQFLQKYSGATVPVSKYDERNLIAEKITNNVVTIYNGIDATTINPKQNFPVLVKEKRKILCIARISPQKDFPMFVRIAEKFQNSNTAFIWIGSAQDKTISELAKEYKISSNVYLLGDIPNASDYIKLADIFVLFTHFEGLPMSIIEALSQEKPIIASDVGGNNELVDSSNGYLIHNDEEAEKSIKELLDSDELLLTKGNNSKLKFDNLFTLKQMWINYKNLYIELLKK